MTGYLLLAGAILAELLATLCLKLSAGFSVLWPSIGCVIGYVACFYMFGKALLTIDLGVGYATWSAVGIIFTAIVGILAFGEKLTLAGIIGITLIVVGVILVNLFGTVK